LEIRPGLAGADFFYAEFSILVPDELNLSDK
jgi:hypothetical protein